jgi:hypothetical protein
MTEFWRALRTLKALQAEQAADTGPDLGVLPLDAQPKAAARPPLAQRLQPDEPERRLEYTLPKPPARGRTLHEPAAPWLPKEPEPRQKTPSAPARPDLVPIEPGPRGKFASAPARPDLVPIEPGPRGKLASAPARIDLVPNEPGPHRV